MKKIYGISALVIFIGAVILSVAVLSNYKPITVTKLNDSDGKIPKVNTELPVKATVNSVNEFGFNLFKNMFKEKENILICPPSMYQTVGALYAASNGDTKTQIGNVLSATAFNNNEIKKLLQGSSNISITNSMWIKKDFEGNVKKDFSDLLKNNYFTAFTGLDFSKPLADFTMNDFVNSSTKNIFDTAVDAEIIDNNNIFMINTATAGYGFASPFDMKNTKGGDFNLADRVSRVYMMNKKDKLMFAQNKMLSLVTVPLSDEKSDMHIILPKTNIVDTVNYLSAGNFDKLLSSRVEKNIELTMPQLSIQMQKSNVAVSLQKMGMKNAFNKTLADFSGMITTKGFFVDNIIHKTMLVANETNGGTKESSYKTGELISFTANKPYLIVITDRKTGVNSYISFIYQPQ